MKSGGTQINASVDVHFFFSSLKWNLYFSLIKVLMETGDNQKSLDLIYWEKTQNTMQYKKKKKNTMNHSVGVASVCFSCQCMVYLNKLQKQKQIGPKFSHVMQWKALFPWIWNLNSNVLHSILSSLHAWWGNQAAGKWPDFNLSSRQMVKVTSLADLYPPGSFYLKISARYFPFKQNVSLCFTPKAADTSLKCECQQNDKISV